MEYFLASLLFFATPSPMLPASAPAPDPCAFEVKAAGALQIQRMRYGPNKHCVLMVTPTSAGETWRSFNYFESGLFMIFFSFGSGDPSEDTGSRAYYTFPRLTVPTFEIIDDQLLVKDASGRSYSFSTSSGRLLSIERATFDLRTSVKKENLGGFQILSFEGLLLDNGFSIGELPYVRPDGESIFYRDSGRACRSSNQELFEYFYKQKPDGSRFLDHVDFRFDDSQLEEFLKIHCDLPAGRS